MRAHGGGVSVSYPPFELFLKFKIFYDKAMKDVYIYHCIMYSGAELVYHVKRSWIEDS